MSEKEHDITVRSFSVKLSFLRSNIACGRPCSSLN